MVALNRFPPPDVPDDVFSSLQNTSVNQQRTIQRLRDQLDELRVDSAAKIERLRNELASRPPHVDRRDPWILFALGVACGLAWGMGLEWMGRCW